MNEIMSSGLIVGLLAMFLWTPYLMARGISKIAEVSGPVDYVLCAIPIVNLARAEKLYYGKFKLCTFSPILFAIAIVSRMYIWRNMYENVTVGTISIVIFWAALIFWMLSNMIFVYTVIHDAEAMSGVKLILMALLFPFGQYYVGTMLSNVIRHMKEREATFK